MAVSCQVVRFQKELTGVPNATQDVNLNFTPKAIIIISDGNEIDNTVSNHYHCSYGFSDGTNHACTVSTSDDADAAEDAQNVHYNNIVAGHFSETNNSTILWNATCAFSTNKVTFTYPTNTADSRATYNILIAYGGDDITNVKVATTTIGTTSDGDRSYTGLGFTPTTGNGVLFTLEAGFLSSELNFTKLGAEIGIGCAVSSTKRWSLNNNCEDTSDPSDTWRAYFNDKCLSCLVPTTGALNYNTDFTGWVSDGFTLNIQNTPSNSTISFSYLVINGGNWDCGSLQSPTTATNDVDYSISVNSNTVRGLVMATVGTATLTTPQTQAIISVGVTDGTNKACMGSIDEDAQATTDSYRVNNSVNIMQPLTANGANLEVATFDSFTTTNFRLDWGTATASQEYYGWVVVADAAAAAAADAAAPHSYGKINTMFDNNQGPAIFG